MSGAAANPALADLGQKIADAAIRAQFETALIRTGDGKGSRACLANALAYLRYDPRWQGVLGFNEFSLYTTALKPSPWGKVGTWSDTDDSLCAEWLQQAGVMVNSKVAAEAVQVAAMENGFHPIRDYLAELRWDGTPRIERWLSVYLGAVDNEWSAAAGKRWLISAVARVMRPGCQVDHTLLLEGPQGIRKSTALRVLAGDEYFADHISELGSKDSRCELSGLWIVEMAELDRVHRAQLERVKAFLTARHDHFRPPYGRRALDVPRSCVFAGSVNDENSLTDETGNRRFWPVRCSAIDIHRLTLDRDQLWAETYQRYRDGENWWFETESLNTLARAEQNSRYAAGVWDAEILAWLERPCAREYGSVIESEQGRVTVSDILVHAVGKSLDRCNQTDKNQVARCLVHNGWKRKQAGAGEDRGRWFYEKDTL